MRVWPARLAWPHPAICTCTSKMAYYSRVVSRLSTKATVANLRRREDAAAVAAVAAGGMHALAEFSFLP